MEVQSTSPAGIRDLQAGQTRVSGPATSPSGARGDSLQLSTLAQLLGGRSINSAVIGTSSQNLIDFSLDYACGKDEHLSASGSYSRKTSSLSLSFDYLFNRQVVIDGQLQTRRFSLHFDINAQNVREESVQPFKEKEDILKFLRRVVDEIFKRGNEDGSILAGVVFAPEDLADIAGIDKGKLLKLVHELIMTLAMIVRMRQAQTHEKLDPVLLTPQREVSEGMKASASQSNELSVSVSMEQEESPTSGGGIDTSAPPSVDS